MFFFALLVIVSLVAGATAAVLRRLAGRPQPEPSAMLREAMRWGMTGGLLFAGIDHLVTPGRYVPMVEGLLPMPDLVILFTGLCEIAGAIGLQVPRLRRLAAILLAAYFVCVFPANIRNAVMGLAVEGLPQAQWYYWVRLLFQPLAILWPLFAAGVILPHWPRIRHRSRRAQTARP